jgi:glycosyltransferase involved in cell wall biosynthesis
VTHHSKIFIALPVIDELDYIAPLLECISKQTYQNFDMFVCVNQPEQWWNDDDKINVCYGNAATISALNKITNFPVHIIDKSSAGHGWDKKNFGVGWARKTVMDAISKVADKTDIILCLDGDTIFEPEYFASLIKTFAKYPKANAISVPYYHPLSGNPDADRAILRYEIYMRYYAINLLRIGNPYAFSALGSAIACKVSAYRAIGGLTPHKSGEDFYFLQKLRKYGPIIIDHPQKVYPAARFSDRVFFGTGPAMIKGAGGDWQSYPVYNFQLFDEVKQTFDAFPDLFEKDIETPMERFFEEKFKTGSVWKPLRNNSKTVDNFVRACQHKVDGLRILQYIKWRQKQRQSNDVENLVQFIQMHYPDDPLILAIDWKRFSFELSDIEILKAIRDSLVEKEEAWQRQIKILKG